MNDSKLQKMLGVFEEELCALLEVVARVNPQEEMAFHERLREKMKGLREEGEEMENHMAAQLAKTKALLDERKALLDERESLIAEREAVLQLNALRRVSALA